MVASEAEEGQNRTSHSYGKQLLFNIKHAQRNNRRVGESYSHEVGHLLGLGHDKRRGSNSMMSYSLGNRWVNEEDVKNVITNALHLSKQVENSNVRILLKAYTKQQGDRNQLFILNQDNSRGKSMYYDPPEKK